MLTFRKYKEEDSSKLYSMLSQSNLSHLVYSSTVINSPKVFEQWMNAAMKQWHEFFIVESDGVVIGYVYDYEYDQMNQICKLCVFMDEKHSRLSFGVKAGCIFIDYLFKNYPIRKIYTEIFSYNKGSIETAMSCGFVEESMYIIKENMRINIYYLKIGKDICKRLKK